MNKPQIKLIERKVKSFLTIGEPSDIGFIYTRELIEEVLRQQQPLIDNKTLFVTIGYTGNNLEDGDVDKVEGFVTGVEITEDNKVTYTIQFLEKIVNFYLDMNIPMSVEIPIKAKIIENKYLTEVEVVNYIDMIFNNPKETLEKLNNVVDSIKEVVTKIEVK